MIGFFTDEIMHKSYLVLEAAGAKNLAEFIDQERERVQLLDHIIP